MCTGTCRVRAPPNPTTGPWLQSRLRRSHPTWAEGPHVAGAGRVHAARAAPFGGPGRKLRSHGDPATRRDGALHGPPLPGGRAARRAPWAVDEDPQDRDLVAPRHARQHPQHQLGPVDGERRDQPEPRRATVRRIASTTASWAPSPFGGCTRSTSVRSGPARRGPWTLSRLAARAWDGWTTEVTPWRTWRPLEQRRGTYVHSWRTTEASAGSAWLAARTATTSGSASRRRRAAAGCPPPWPGCPSAYG